MDYRKDGIIFMKLDSNNQRLTYTELKNCESVYENRVSYNNGENETAKDESELLICENSSSDESSENIKNIFGDDWSGKPGVSSESESEDFFGDNVVEVKKKRLRNQPFPSHIEIIPGDKTKYKCTVCIKTFGCKSHVRYHAYCAQPKAFLCHLCSKSFSKKNLLNYHIKTHTGERPYTCLICDKSFLQLDKLKRHKRIHFGNNIKCDSCDEKFRDTNSLNEHRKIHLLPNICVYKCDSCDKSFKNKSNLNKHIKGVHSAEKLFICEYCGKSFAWKYNLICHIKTHSGIRAYSCPECKRRFKNKNDCRKHGLTHVDEHDYKCDMCNATFKRRDNLVRHLRNIHPEIESPKIVKMNQSSEPTTSSEKSTPNRISVIKQISAPCNSVPSSVIRHVSRNYQPAIINDNIRECVIKSTKK